MGERKYSDKLKEILRKIQNKETSPETEKENDETVIILEKYIKDFELDIFEDNLTSKEILYFAVAQALEEYIDKLNIPAATTEKTGQEKVEIISERVRNKTVYKQGEQSTDIPANQMEVTNVKRPEELPAILPSEWLVEDVAPELFLKRLKEGELLRKDWRETTKTPIVSEETVKEKKIIEKESPPDDQTHHAYVLLDTSGSMIENTDGRNIVAIGTALAFLRRNYLKRAHLAYRNFTSGVGGLSQGSGREQLRQTVQRILNTNFRGDTNIDYAIRYAVADIEEHGVFKRADILLITDGLSELGDNPLGKVRLHTVLVGDPLEEAERDINWLYEVKKNLTALESWSTSFIKMDNTKEFINDLVVTEEEVQEIERESKAIPELINKLTDQKQVEQIQKRIKSLLTLLDFYRSQLTQEENQTAKNSFKKRLEVCERKLREFTQGDASEITKKALEQKRQETAERQRKDEIQSSKNQEQARQLLKKIQKGLPYFGNSKNIEINNRQQDSTDFYQEEKNSPKRPATLWGIIKKIFSQRHAK